MKKLILFALAIVLIASLSACGAAPADTMSVNTSQSQTVVVVVEQLAAPAQAPATPAKAPAANAETELHKPAEFQTIEVNSVEYGTNFTDRLTFTNGEILTGHTAPYAGEELTKIQTTWVEYNVEVPEGAAYAVAFAYSVKIDGKEYQPGAIIMLPTSGGIVKVNLLDGELIFWRDFQAMHDDISNRISTEIANGNLSIDGPLAFSYCSQEFSGYVPRDLLDARKVTLVK